MPLSDSQRAVVDFLVEPRGAQCTPGRSAAHPTPSSCRGLPLARPESVRFLKTRAFDRCELHAVAYSAAAAGHPLQLVVRTARGDDGDLRVSVVGGGSAGRLERERPWVNLTAQWGSTFRAGGAVIGAGSERAGSVRLRFADGTAVEDSVDAGWVLFEVGHGVAFPAEVEVRDAAGAVLAAYSEFDGFD